MSKDQGEKKIYISQFMTPSKSLTNVVFYFKFPAKFLYTSNTSHESWQGPPAL